MSLPSPSSRRLNNDAYMSQSNKLRIVCISDTHNAAPGEGYTLPRGDVLIHAGDLTNQGSLSEITKALTWIERADFALKVVVAGNHDLSLDPNYATKHADGWTVQPEHAEKSRELVRNTSTITYLQHQDATLNVPGRNVSLRIFGSPFSPDRGHQNWAFQYTEDQAQKLWAAIPAETDILITHTPAVGHCDASEHWKEGGCPYLSLALQRVRPLLHICGHCHEGHGARFVRWSDRPNENESVRTWEDPGKGNKKQSLLDLTGTRSGDRVVETGRETAVVNASVMARSFGRGSKQWNKPIVVDVDLSQWKSQSAEGTTSAEARGGGHE